MKTTMSAIPRAEACVVLALLLVGAAGLQQAQASETYHVYWADRLDKTLERAELDGSNVTELFTSVDGLYRPWGVCIDVTNGHVYLSDVYNKVMLRSDLDGSNKTTYLDSVAYGSGQIKDMDVDTANGKIYWVDYTNNAVVRANLSDGSSATTIISGTTNSYYPLDIQVVGSNIYYSCYGSRKIHRANLDGSGITTILTSETANLTPGFFVDGDYIYWADSDTTIKKAALSDVAGTATPIYTSGTTIQYLTVGEDKLYWTDIGLDKVLKCNLDGTSVEDVVTGLNDPRGIGLDIPEPTMVALLGLGGVGLLVRRRRRR